MNLNDRHHKPPRRIRRALIGGAIATYAALLGGVAVNAGNYRLAHPVACQQAGNEVLICTGSGAYAYHSHRCWGLNRCKASIVRTTRSKAEQKGYRPCRNCYK